MLLESSAAIALFLDLDGTLIEIAPTPAGVLIPHGLVAVLHELTLRLGGALAIVTGRRIAEIDRFLAPLVPVAAGIHGAELRVVSGGAIELMAGAVDAAVAAAVSRMAAAVPGVVVEMKRASIAVHYRLVPAVEPVIEAALRDILRNGSDHLILCHGRKVLEIVPRSVSKGRALELLLAQPGFRGRRPIMIGDDVSDQSAFAAAVRLGGMGLKVKGEQFGEKADFSGPAAVREWLTDLSRSLAT